ncbi:MAG: L-lactate dehydrogenase [Bacilli bacterium]|nr:L-lactate dehydrogenase [Bacilli bacterium]
MKNKIVVIGCGNVGMAYIYALVNSQMPIDEIALIDMDQKRIEGEVLDLQNCIPLLSRPLTIKVGNYEDCKDASIVCITAGAAQTMGSRMNGLSANCKIFKSILDKVMSNAFNGIFLIASNPLDVMTYFTYKYTNYEPNKVIGTGTLLDTARLHCLLKEEGYQDNKSCVLGEHGDSSFIVWDKEDSNEKGNYNISSIKRLALEQSVREMAYEIVKRKGSTYYGIGYCLARLTSAILNDEKVVLPVSNYDKENELYISTLCMIGKEGIEKRIESSFTNEEEQKMKDSKKIIKEAIKTIE